MTNIYDAVCEMEERPEPSYPFTIELYNLDGDNIHSYLVSSEDDIPTAKDIYEMMLA